ncbi:MAG TPA: chitinase [Cyanobacteria bacterium UBA11370]|nr:chitinase [Cyanobacteria bacterium UBA11370]HBY78720.1 chitinase [Cyanobacteria bacterium UBA11148]
MKPDGTPFTDADAGSLQVGQEICLPSDSPPVGGGNGGSATGYKLVGYFENWAQYRPEGKGKFFPEQIDPSLLTHINFAFGIFGFVTWSVDQTKTRGGESRYTGDYTIQPVEWNDQTTLYPAIQKLKEKNPNLKTLLSIGGWSFNSGDDKPDSGNPHPFGPYTYKLFSQMASSSAGRQQFISSAIEYAHKYGFDGIDIDWEYPGDRNRGGTDNDFENFLALLNEFRSAINNDAGGQKLLLTIASPAIKKGEAKTPQQFFDWLAQCAEYLDWMNVMSYDYHGVFPDDKVTGVNAPLLQDSTPGGNFSLKDTVEAYLVAQIPKDKILLGMPTYGRTFKVTSPLTDTDNGPGKPYSGAGSPGQGTRTPGFLAYYEILEGLSSGDWKRGWDQATLTPYAYNSKTGEWVSYDDAESFAYKVSYLIEQGLAGAMVWAIDDDQFF